MNGLGINRFENLHFSTRESVFARRKNLPTAKMSTTVFLCFIVLLMLPGIAESICCDDIKAQAESKYNAYKTLCSTGNNLPANCCGNIATEVKKFRDSYKALCQLSSKFVINNFCSYVKSSVLCLDGEKKTYTNNYTKYALAIYKHLQEIYKTPVIHAEHLYKHIDIRINT